MNLVVLGGSVFVGRWVVEHALERGHRVTMFNRGQHNPDLFPEAEKVRGDRDRGLDALTGRTWDSVIDTCGYVPRVVRQSVAAGLAPHYTFISTISVYDLSSPSPAPGERGLGGEGPTEDSPLATIEDEAVEEVNGDTYGALKVLCEREVAARYDPAPRPTASPRTSHRGEGALILRPGLIVGPWDKTDRFTYWPARIAEGGAVVVPEWLDQPTQFMDVRDLAAWTIRMVEKGATGTFNATGPGEPMTLGGLFEACRSVCNPKARLVPVPSNVLAKHKVENWTDLPLVMTDDGSDWAIDRVDISRAVAAGLSHRAVEDTIRDTLDWFRTGRPEGAMKAGLTREKESEVVASLGAPA